MNNLKPPTVSMTVRLIDGSIRRFRFSSDGADDVTLGSRIEKGFQAHDLALELGDRLLVIPKDSILTIELTPAPAKLPASTVRNGQMIDE
jgi:hypothetical protein